MSNSSIMTIQEMIDSAFGEADKNIVNFKLTHTILHILARQLRLLQRKVEVEIDPILAPASSSLSVTEIKMKANVPRRKRKQIKAGGPQTQKGSGSKKLAEKAILDKTKTGSMVSVIDKSSEITSSEKTTSKSTTDRTTTSTEITTDKSKDSSDRTRADAQKKKFSSQDYPHLLEIIEQQREQELRVVNQRADSREEAKKTPTPMASLDEMEVQYEKLLIVERVSTDKDLEAKTGDRKEPLTVVTQDQFDSLAKLVKELQEKFSVVGRAEFPENIQLMQDLRRGASLTDAMAALQLSARVEAAEKTLEQMMSLVTDLALKKGIDITNLPEKDHSVETEVLFGAPDSSQVLSKSPHKSKVTKKLRPAIRKSTVATSYDTVEAGEAKQPIEANYEITQPKEETGDIEIYDPTFKPDWITPLQLDEEMQLLYNNLLKMVTTSISKSSSSADSALKIATRLEKKINKALNLDTRMDDLEILVTEYAAQINTLDTGLSSYMTDYQDQLTQMQHDLEAGLESMAEAMANTGGDTAAVAELNSNITNLQMEFDVTNMKQKKLKDQQTLLLADLEGLWKQIEVLRGTKSDREEVADALRDKAGLGALNGLVSQEQFSAVRGDFEKRIGAAYDKFNNQEIIWQKAIDDLLRELNEKADWMQVASLRDDVNANLEKLMSKINAILNVVGEPRSAAVSKKLFHDTTCLSCASPAHMNIEEPGLIPTFPAFPKSGTHSATTGADTKPKEDGDHNLCYPGQPIPHPRDLRSHICQRYCGGSHTVITGTISRAPVGMIISPALRRITTEVGTDGRVYMTDQQDEGKPCLPCNLPKPTPQLSEMEEAPVNVIESPSFDFFMDGGSTTKQIDSVSETPPPPLDDY